MRGPVVVLGKRFRREPPRVAFVADNGKVKEHAQRRNQESKPQVEASHSLAVDGAEAAISAREAD